LKIIFILYWQPGILHLAYRNLNMHIRAKVPR